MFTKPNATDETKSHAQHEEETLGSYFKTARQSQGLELSEISQATRINHKNLIALEENNRADLPADVFNRGFVKLYASYLKLDPQEALRLYEKQWAAQNPISTTFSPPKISPSLARPSILISLLLIAIVLGIRLYYPGQAAPPSVLLPASVNQPTDGNETTPPSASPPSVAAEEESQTIAPSTTTTPEELEPVEAESSSLIAAISPPPYEIELQSLQTTIIEIALDGQKAIKKTLQPGGKQIWQAAKTFDLTIDSTSEITLTVNGSIVPIPTETGQSVTIHRP